MKTDKKIQSPRDLVLTDIIHKALTDQILGVFFDVYNELGYGFLEKVYENSLSIALQNQGLTVTSQQHIKVNFRENCVGEYFADLIVEDKIILELKATQTLNSSHEAQLVNYLRAHPHNPRHPCSILSYSPLPTVQ